MFVHVWITNKNSGVRDTHFSVAPDNTALSNQYSSHGGICVFFFFSITDSL